MLNLRFIHRSTTRADFKFAIRDKSEYELYKQKIEELLQAGYIKVKETTDSLNRYEYYRLDGDEKMISVAVLCR